MLNCSNNYRQLSTNLFIVAMIFYNFYKALHQSLSTYILWNKNAYPFLETSNSLISTGS